MAELSRGELLAWVNELTSLNLPKVESMGTGSAHCLIIHSIYGDVPLHKINFKAVHEYEYVQNFKVLQEAFVRHRIDRTIPVDRLIKLKFQDNLEFLQWMKKYWDVHFDGNKNVSNVPAINVTASNKISRSSSIRSTAPSTVISNSTIPNTSNTLNTVNPVNSVNSNTSNTSQTQSNFQLAALTKTITELKLSVDEMEKERDFYFNKLRDIEILTQKIAEPAITESLFFKQITEILYTTEDGFEIPQDNKVEPVENGSAMACN